jgi:hypothetical protein
LARKEEVPAAHLEENTLLTLYEVLTNRRIAHDNLVWQVPVLSLTAQAFLFTVALSGGTNPWARRIAAFLALLSALVSMQTMAKHRWFEKADSHRCQLLEQRLHLHEAFGYAPHEKPALRRAADDPVPSRWVTRSSSDLWQVLLGLFACAAILVIVLSFTEVLS